MNVSLVLFVYFENPLLCKELQKLMETNEIPSEIDFSKAQDLTL